MWSAIDQPTIRRLNASCTAARYSQPFQVRRSVRLTRPPGNPTKLPAHAELMPWTAEAGSRTRIRPNPRTRIRNSTRPLITLARPPCRQAGEVLHQCYTSRMPTKRRRHAITETPHVQAALDELRQELGSDSVELGELVVLGAGVKLDAIRAERDGDAVKRRRLATRVRSRATLVDVRAADEVRSVGWARS
jgi:hypothetical protein